ncbi:unnamed protein product [Euphydryas editha]|uniref:Uncharacterized protein n=1 Tax=Euphydryas editha TaxID=104508 RepID=A0AAU9U3B1_EUPED|nr:unnamed protein product [Euphydryas editha]
MDSGKTRISVSQVEKSTISNKMKKSLTRITVLSIAKRYRHIILESLDFSRVFTLVVVYTKDSTKSYSTVSQNTTLTPAAIWKHLKPIFKTLPTHITGIHFVSDGPVTQYRNKTMFHILATRLHVEVPNTKTFSWNFSKSGHGKSAADGFGATCKRTADTIVATGGDIDSLDSFIDFLLLQSLLLIFLNMF